MFVEENLCFGIYSLFMTMFMHSEANRTAEGKNMWRDSDTSEVYKIFRLSIKQFAFSTYLL